MILTVYRLALRSQARLGRLVALGGLGAVAVLIGIAIGTGDVADKLDAGANLVNAFGLTVYVPVVALVFASAALGDPADDGTLVYLWLRPVPRWRIVAGSTLATLTVVVPLVLVPLLLAAAVSGGGAALLRGTVVSSCVGIIAYVGLFTYLGLRVRRSLVWGLAYILLWEGFVALAGQSAARLAVRSYTRSLLSNATGIHFRLADTSVPVAIVVPIVVGLLALALTTARLRRMEVP
jgi:ABC-2 type transport system permease protein